MNRRHAIHAGVVVGVLVFVVAYLVQVIWAVPTITYHPAPGIAMAWYGHLAVAIAFGGAAFAITCACTAD